MKTLYIGCLTLALCTPAQAIDLQSYRKYQEHQQTAQAQELELAREALSNGDLDTAQQHLEAARNMAYAPEEIAAVEQQIATERARIEQARRASEPRETQSAAQSAASSSTAQISSRVTFHLTLGVLRSNTHHISVEVVDNSSGFRSTGSGKDYPTIPYMSAGSYTAHITASDSERTLRFSSQFYHPGSGGLLCNYHIEHPNHSSPAIFGECEPER